MKANVVNHQSAVNPTLRFVLAEFELLQPLLKL